MPETTPNAARKIDIYPVGWLAAILRAWRYLTYANPPPCGRRQAVVELRHAWRYMFYQIRRRNWRAVKNSFNGYLCEPTPFPPGVTRCGSGWTRVRAYRSLERQMRKARRG